METTESATSVDRIVRTSSIVGDLRQLSHDLKVIGVESVKGKHPDILWEAARRLELMDDVLRQMRDANLHEGNCASLEVATRRIRTMANRGLS